MNYYEINYKNLAQLFGGYFHADVESTYDEIMKNEVLQSFNPSEVISEIDNMISENLSDPDLGNVFMGFGSHSISLMKQQAGVTTNRDWLLDIKRRFEDKLTEES